MSNLAFAIDWDGYLTDAQNRRVPRIPASAYVPPPIAIADDEVRLRACGDCHRPINAGKRCAMCAAAWKKTRAHEWHAANKRNRSAR